jgi:hypothetical protein
MLLPVTISAMKEIKSVEAIADEKERNTTTMMKMTPDDRESSLQRQ